MAQQINYEAYLLGELLKTIDTEFKALEYDLQFIKTISLYEQFTKHKANQSEAGTYECILNFINQEVIIYQENSVYEELIYWAETFSNERDEDDEEWDADNPDSPENKIRNLASMWHEAPHLMTQKNWRGLFGTLEVLNEGRRQNEEPIIVIKYQGEYKWKLN